MNGIQDKGEDPLTNILVELFIVGETTPEDDTSSNKDGMYKFEGVAEGDYRLKFTRPNDSTITEKDSEEYDTVDSDIYAFGNDTGWTDPFNVGSGEHDTRDAGFYKVGPVPTNTPTPEGVFHSPTGVPFTETPAVMDPTGEYVVLASVLSDKAKHEEYVKITENSTVKVEKEGDLLKITFGSGDGTTEITLEGQMDESDNVTLSGSGTLAGFENVSGTFEGKIVVGPDGSVLIEGDLTLGAGGELPQGDPIRFLISS